MINKYFLSVFFAFYFVFSNSQNKNDIAKILKNTNVEKLKKIAKECDDHFRKDSLKAKKLGIKMEIFNDDKQKGIFSGFDEEGKPTYIFNTNDNAAFATRVDVIWEGGTSGLNLNGEGIKVGVWETGIPLITHQELKGDTKVNDGSQTITEHATHVAGTITGKGVNERAKGMATGATILAHDTRNRESEIAKFSTQGGILSNHSYSISHDDFTNYYGLYSKDSQNYDEIIFNSPYHTFCIAAGNHRYWKKERFNTVLEYATCKNVISVGGMSYIFSFDKPRDIFSFESGSQGPTDDWRIKPDFAAQARDVFSATNTNDTAYTFLSGTSMATPGAAGAIALLQQHYHNLNSTYMKAATVKALTISTTTEAGRYDGPDFEYGWGVLNASRAANTITNNGNTTSIKELSLNNNQKYSTSVEVDGSTPFTCAIAWTDPAGEIVQSGINELKPRLINDLDIRLTRNGVEYKPWVMTPNSTKDNYRDAATKGDNFRDNVERIDVKSLPKGTYNITVTHKGRLVNSKQDFSLVVRGLSEKTLSTSYFQKNRESLEVYPNPSRDGLFTVNIESINSTEQQIEIYDMLGRLVAENIPLDLQNKLNLSSLPSGTYILKISSNNKVINQLITINK